MRRIASSFPFLAFAFAFAVAAAVAAPPASAQRVAIDAVAATDTAVRHEARLHDGSRLVGRITLVTADSVRLEMQSGAHMLARSAIAEVRQFSAASVRNGEIWPENPAPTRLLFSATAYPLARGEGYYWNAWIFLNGFAVGVNDRFTMGGGFSILPSDDFLRDNFFFITPKVTLTSGTGPQVAVGALAGLFPGFSSSDGGESVGILYGVSSLGTRERNLTVGLGWGYVGSDIADRPVVMVGGQSRFSRRAAFVSENWFLPGESGFGGVLSYGLRFMGEKLSVDLALVNAVEEPIFPGVPWLGFSIKF